MILNFKKYKLLLFVILTFFSSVLTIYAQENSSLTITHDGNVYQLTLDKLHQQLKLQTIDVDDPVYKRHKHYAGYWLLDILSLAHIQLKATDTIVFQALDGYQAHLPVMALKNMSVKGLVAIKDLDMQKGWAKIQQGKDWITPAPFYLVWQGLTKNRTLFSYPWPYQIISIDFIDSTVIKLNPAVFDGTTTLSVKRGYTVFYQNCFSCHSLNLQGGVIGPELNIPRNILEYQNRAYLKAFIQNPSSFRAQDKMPAFNQILSKEDLEDVLDYLAFMAGHKISPK